MQTHRREGHVKVKKEVKNYAAKKWQGLLAKREECSGLSVCLSPTGTNPDDFLSLKVDLVVTDPKGC